jgi:hypothetical protein
VNAEVSTNLTELSYNYPEAIFDEIQIPYPEKEAVYRLTRVDNLDLKNQIK